MKTLVTFTSQRFTPFLPEDSQVNPGYYGAELAWWLSRQLAAEGVVTSYPEYEDWGWFIDYFTTEEDEYWLGCGNVDGTRDRWRIFLDAKPKGLFRRKQADIENARPLLSALEAVLKASDLINDIRWEDNRASTGP